MAIRIRCKQPGFRRAGVAHIDDRIWPAGAFTEEQLALLKAEPMLILEEMAEPSLREILAAGVSFASGGLTSGGPVPGSNVGGNEEFLADPRSISPLDRALLMPVSPIPEAQPAAEAEGQQAKPEPGAEAQSSDAGAPAPEAGDAPAGNPASETGEVAGAAPAAAPEAASTRRGRSKG